MLLKYYPLKDYQIPVFVINLKERSILNIPTQIGCMVGCTFCPSTTQKIIRNITDKEFLDIITFAKSLATSNNMLLSFTGEGEVYLNHQNVNKVIETLQTDKEIQDFRLCTSGIKINKFHTITSRIKPISMQLSIHSLFNEKRKEIIPKTKNVEDIFKKIKDNQKIFQEISINYVLIEGFNDRYKDLNAIKEIIDKKWLIKFNPLIESPKSKLRKSKKTEEFMLDLKDNGYTVKSFSVIGSTIENKFNDKLIYQEIPAINQN